MNVSQLTPASHASELANAPMERFAVDGRELALYRIGLGTPTVILETGLGAESNEWAAVQRSIGAITLVCRYDRAGRGASEPAPASPRSAGAIVDELHALLRAARVPGPYI